MQVTTDEIRFLEELSLNALPSLQTVVHDGWLLRFAAGYTSRANSVQPQYPGIRTLDEKVGYCEAAYRSQGLPCIFKLTDAASPEGLDEVLACRGYTIRTPVSVQTLDLSRVPPGSEAVHIEVTPSDAWVEAFLKLAPVDADKHDTFRQTIRSIVPATGFGSRVVDGEIVSMGLAVVEQGWVGLYDIVTAEGQRRVGHGRTTVQGLLGWARERGARRAYLQVTKTNEKGLALYAGLGFEEAYSYWYRARQG